MLTASQSRVRWTASPSRLNYFTGLACMEWNFPLASQKHPGYNSLIAFSAIVATKGLKHF